MDWLDWEELSEASCREILSPLLPSGKKSTPNQLKLKGVSAKLSFYKKFRLVRIDVTAKGSAADLSLFFLWNSGRVAMLLDGTSEPLYAANKAESLRLTSDQGADYIRLFCFSVRTENGSFTLLEKIPEGYAPKSDEIAKLYKPVAFGGEDKEGNFLYDVAMAFGTIVARVKFLLPLDGTLEMADDEPLNVTLPPNAIPKLPALGSPGSLRPLQLIEADDTAAIAEAVVRGKKPVHFIMVEMLLEQALARQSHNRLLGHFNAALAAGRSLDRFAALMVKAFPVVSVESSLSFVEDAIAKIIQERSAGMGEYSFVNVSTEQDGLSMSLRLPVQGPAIALIPFYSNCRLNNPDRIAYELATKDISAILACDSFSSLPESLKVRCDIKLTLPPIDASTFESLFAQVMEAPPPSDWRVLGEDWVRHVIPTDFEHPRRMSLKPDAAFDYVHAQVTERLAAIDPERALGLDQLYGLGEARQFAEDLITDIHAACKGKLPWSQVDQGALLVGPPGTGKTTLAKAIAKDCGVKFILASANAWMASGEHLGHHIRAIRQTFADARRYAPSILFIDEIDGLGNRETFSGPHAQYLIEVVNAVLEQLQGLDPAAPVFILGATNYVERVDPALRRSGRLDRVINIPFPNTESLSKIYGHYLASLAQEVGVNAAVDTKALGGLSLGLTGADVERIVRGAVRRARKERRSVSQNDLIAEVTGKSRSVEGTLRMSAAEMERTAWHESGHAIASYLSGSKGADIGFVTIVPRSDGTLGFVARVPDERVSFTYRDYVDRLEILLAGRAAEEIKYGEDHISSGASSDLRTASAIAIRMATQLALGKSHALLWSEQPNEEHLQRSEALLREVYGSAMLKLTENRQLLQSFANELLEKQELTGDQARQIFSGGSDG